MNITFGSRAIFGNNKFNEYIQQQFVSNENTLFIISKTCYLNIEENIKKNIAPFCHIHSGDPTTEVVDFLVEKYSNIKQIFGVGGGSVLDLAKAVAACLELNKKSSQLLGLTINKFRQNIKLILCPTTSGTGSEMSMASVVTDSRDFIKSSIRGEVVLSDLSIIDPTLSLFCNRETTVDCGYDCFTHAVETFISNKSNSYIQNNSIYILKKQMHNLPLVLDNLKNIDLREELSFCSFLAGINLSSSSTCLPHRLQYVFSSKINLSHGRCLALIYPAWIKATYNRHDKFKILEDKLGINNFLEFILNFKDKLHLKEKWSDYVTQSELQSLIYAAKGNLQDDPGYDTKVLEDIYNYFI